MARSVLQLRLGSLWLKSTATSPKLAPASKANVVTKKKDLALARSFFFCDVDGAVSGLRTIRVRKYASVHSPLFPSEYRRKKLSCFHSGRLESSATVSIN